MSATPTITSTLSSSHGTYLVQNKYTSAGAGHVGAGPTTKDVRACEHARQRTKTKERREHALARERKQKAAAGSVLGLKGSVSVHGAHGHGGHGGASVGKLARRLSMESWDGYEPRATGTETGTAEKEEEKEVRGAVVPLRSEHDGGKGVRAHGFTELTLGDMISRPWRPKAKQLDFEVISPIRTVIALDDAIDGDEPWEYITRASLNDGSTSWKCKSYAQAVASAM